MWCGSRVGGCEVQRPEPRRGTSSRGYGRDVLRQIATDVHLVAGTAVNWVLVRDGDALTVVDTGWPGDADRLDASVRALGLRPQDVAAVLLTHAHVDHVGGAAAWSDLGVPVLTHPDEVALARGEAHEQASTLDVARRAWRPSVVRWSARIVRAGALRHPPVPHATAWPVGGADGSLDLPGSPVPVPTPGHTSGHAAYLLPRAGVVVTGDALVTGHPLLRCTGPQVLPGFFATDPARVPVTLGALRELDADTIAPGHGEPWSGPLAEAVDRAVASA